MFNTSKLLLASAIALTISGCGGGGGGGHSGSSSSGTAIDGYLTGSTVTCDANANGTADADEAYVITDANGDFKFAPACSAGLLISGGMNKVSGGTSYPFLGELKAPAGSTVITPLTTLLVETGLAEADLVAMLGLPVGTSLKTTDPVAAAEADPANVKLLQTGIAVQQMINELAKVFTTAPGSTGSSSAIFKKLADTLAASPATVLFDANGNFDATILSDTAAAVNNALPVAQQIDSTNLTALTTSIQTQSASVMTATNLSTLVTVATTVQNPATQPTGVTIPAQQNYLYLNADAFKINGGNIPFATFTSVSGANTSTLSTIDFDFELMGTPVVNQDVSMVLSLVEQAGGNDVKVQVMLSKVNIVKNASDELEVNVSADSDIYVYGRTATGKKVNVLIKNLDADVVSVDSATNTVSLDYVAIVNNMLANDQVISNKQVADLQTLLNLSGTFTTKLVVSNLNYRYAIGDALPLITAGVDGAVNAANKPVPTITGYGLAGTLVIAP